MVINIEKISSWRVMTHEQYEDAQMYAKLWDAVIDAWCDERILGSGTGELLGILNSTEVVHAEPRAITYDDVVDMYHRLTPPAYRAAALLPEGVASRG